MRDHARLCEGREYTCTCGYDKERDELPSPHVLVTDKMVSAARRAYSKATGCDDTPHVLDGWIEDALRSSLEAALSNATPEKQP